MFVLFFCLRCYVMYCFFFFKQKTAYDMRISDWSSDVCSSDLLRTLPTWQSVSGLVGSLEGFKVAGLCARLPTPRLWKLNESVLMIPKDSKECVGEAARLMTFSERLGWGMTMNLRPR